MTYTGARACGPVRASGFTGPIGMPISRLVRRVDGITEGYLVMGSYVRTGPRAFQHTLSIHLAAVLAVEIGGIPSCADKTGAHVNGGRRYAIFWDSPQGFRFPGGS